jgi:nicotinate-nucleotide pyrophosphorylase (carboxylating)
MEKERLRKLIAIWFDEDIRDGDHTSLSCIPADAQGCQQLIIKEDGILAGIDTDTRNGLMDGAVLNQPISAN